MQLNVHYFCSTSINMRQILITWSNYFLHFLSNKQSYLIFVTDSLSTMFETEFHKPFKSVSSLVKQFETIRSSDDTKMEDKFVPRHNAAMVFQFKKLPCIVNPKNIERNPFFIAPLVYQANTLKISDELDTDTVVCHPFVMSFVFNGDMTSARDLNRPFLN